MKQLFAILLFLFVWGTVAIGDIVLPGRLHPGNNHFDNLTPPDPLTIEEYSRVQDSAGNLYITVYPYYPSRFYLTEPIVLKGIELKNVEGFYDEGNLWVEIDGQEYGPSDDGNTTLLFDSPLSLDTGMHTLAMHGSCFYKGDEVDCDARKVNDVDDFDFETIVLITGQTTLAWHDLTRHHTGDNDDDDDNYDNLGDGDYKPFWYPDEAEARNLQYSIRLDCPVSGIDFFLSRLRDIDKNDLNTFVFDPDSNDEDGGTSYYLNAEDDGAHDLWIKHTAEYGQISNGLVTISSEKISSRDYDDFSWDSLIVVPRCKMVPKAAYRMDACGWRGEVGEVIDASGNGYHGRAVLATTAPTGMVCRDGNFSHDSQDAETEEEIDHVEVPAEILDGLNRLTVMAWLNLPRVEDRYQVILQAVDQDGGQSFRINIYPYDDTRDRVAVMFNKRVRAFYLRDDERILGKGWHHLAFRADGTGHGCLFIDGELHGCRFHEEWVNSLVVEKPIFLGAKYINKYKNNDLLGEMDEVKFFDYSLPLSMIASIYDYEKNGKNADGTLRSCQECPIEMPPSYRFDAWDYEHDLSDRNITTKVAQSPFVLTIASLNEEATAYQEFNGTVCTRIVQKESNASLTAWYKTLFDERNTTSISVTVSSAVREAAVQIVWKRDVDESCPLSDEENATLSTDSFAVRPERFEFVAPAAEANLTAQRLYRFPGGVKAVTAGGTDPAQDYNTTLALRTTKRMRNGEPNASLAGTLTVNLSRFQDGVADLNLSFDDVAIVTLELNDTAWCAVDADDTPEANRTIYGERNVTFVPAAFGLSFSAKPRMEDNDTAHGFTYLSNDLAMSGWLRGLTIDVKALGEKGGLLRNFSGPVAGPLFADAVDITPLLRLPERHSAANTLGEPQPQTGVDLNFTDGEAVLTYSDVAFNYDRAYDAPIDPFRIPGGEANVTVSLRDVRYPAATGAVTSDFDGGATFYFGRLRAEDLRTTHTSVTNDAELEVFDSSASAFVAGFRQNSLRWFGNAKHASAMNGRIKEANATAGVALDSAADGALSIRYDTYGSGVVTLEINNTSGVARTRTIHLDIDPWLWYVPEGFGEAYDYGSGSDCSRHPCFTYTFEAAGAGGGVSSGDFNGSDFDAGALDANATFERRQGVKLFR